MVNPLAGLGILLEQAHQAQAVGTSMGNISAQGSLAAGVMRAGRGAAQIGQMMSTMAEPKTVRASKTNIKMFQSMRRARGVINMFSGVLDKLIIIQPVLALLGAMISLIGAGIVEELMPYLQDWAEWLSDPENQEALKNIGRAIGWFIARIIDLIRWMVDLGVKMSAFVEEQGGVWETYWGWFTQGTEYIKEQGGLLESYLGVFRDYINYTKAAMAWVGEYNSVLEIYIRLIEGCIGWMWGHSPGLIPAFEALNSLIPTTTGLFGDLNTDMLDLSDTIDTSAIPQLQDLVKLLDSIEAPSWGGGGGGGGGGGKDEGLIPDDIPIIGGLQYGGIAMKPSIRPIAEREPEAVIPLTKLNHMFSDIRAGNDKLLMEINKLRQSVETQGNWDW